MKASVQLTIALALACATTAFAQSASEAKASPALADEQVKAVQEYWTPERLANAKPMPMPKVDPASMSGTAAPIAAEPMQFTPGTLPEVQLEPLAAPSERFPLNQGEKVESEATASPDAFTYEMPFNNYRTGVNNAYPYATMGKLFFVIPAGASEAPGDYVCSASVAVNSHTIVTARHCVYDYVSKLFYGSWVFYPGWNNGSDASLGGAWYADYAYTWTGTAQASLTTGWDIGFIALHDSTKTGCGGDKGYVIAHYTGSLGTTWNGSYAQRQWNAFGYPQASPFEGNYLYQDNGATGAVNPLGSTNVVEIGDPQTGGCSGGPWVIGFDPYRGAGPSPNNNVITGTNFLNGVNSFEWTSPSEPLAINGTVFVTANFINLVSAYNTYSATNCK